MIMGWDTAREIALENQMYQLERRLFEEKQRNDDLHKRLINVVEQMVCRGPLYVSPPFPHEKDPDAYVSRVRREEFEKGRKFGANQERKRLQKVLEEARFWTSVK